MNIGETNWYLPTENEDVRIGLYMLRVFLKLLDRLRVLVHAIITNVLIRYNNYTVCL